MVADLEPDILEREVKWALESLANNKASGGDGIPVGNHRPVSLMSVPGKVCLLSRGPAIGDHEVWVEED